MKHINDDGQAKCRASCPLEDLVTAAMESDCNDCRNLAMVQPVAYEKPKCAGCGVESHTQVPLNVSQAPAYVPEPLPGAEDMLDDLKRRRDGR